MNIIYNKLNYDRGQNWSRGKENKGGEEDREQQIGNVFLFRHELLLSFSQITWSKGLSHDDYLTHFPTFQTLNVLGSIRFPFITFNLLFLSIIFSFCSLLFNLPSLLSSLFVLYLACHPVYSPCLLIRPLHMQFKLPIFQQIHFYLIASSQLDLIMSSQLAIKV